MRVGPTLAVVALGVGAGAAGVALGNLAERRTVRAGRDRPAHGPPEPFGQLPRDRVMSVVADDGVELYVEEVGREDAPLTVVLVHGLANNVGTWHFQRADLARPEDPDLRLVLYDQRAHGRSGRGVAASATLAQLAEDLLLVIRERCPHGPVVLVGHSMGGMAVQELVALRPDLLDGRIAGVGLFSTSAGALTEAVLGPPAAAGRLLRPLLDRRLVASPGVRMGGALVDERRRSGNDLSYELTRRFSFGDRDVSPALVEYVQTTTAEVPMEALVELLPALLAHDREEALDALADVPVMVLCGERDLVTPISHSRAMLARMPHSQMVTVPGAGHMAHLERPGYVTSRLRAFLRQVSEQPDRPPSSGGGRHDPAPDAT